MIGRLNRLPRRLARNERYRNRKVHVRVHDFRIGNIGVRVVGGDCKMSLESIDKLRDCTFIGSGKVNEYLDEIEREIAERYMELPVDADGVPIRVGDVMLDLETPRTAIAVAPDSFVMDGYDTCSYYRPGLARNYHHVKPRTLEDVLFDCYAAIDYDKKAEDGHRKDELLRKYAAEIRELLGCEGE